MITNRTLVLDVSFLNEYKLYRDLRAVDMHSQRVLIMKVEDKGNKNLYEWYYSPF